ncbi:rRNA-binding ribosome biosynthesis protein [Saccharomycopsis crataegensis]|uniref:U3 small nucleolar RNA-associated protein 25 n=1 Tax=Saccharomycopsis crataegensis TaxID=43959 RepID=A0AAV5QPU5_9ASCO|nr:rRNA-binding ribosome biosynthesis protein [Saccharomycopsis crataegensis]
MAGPQRNNHKRPFGNSQKRTFGNSQKRSFGNSRHDQTNKKPKHGRQQMREIKRMGRRHQNEEAKEDFPDFPENDEGYESGDNIGEEPSGAMSLENNPRQAYDALMVLLDNGKDEKKTTKKSEKNTAKVQVIDGNIPGNEDEETEYGIEDIDEDEESVKKEDEEDQNDLSEDEEDEEDDEASSDPFEYHFANPQESILENFEQQVSKDSTLKWQSTKTSTSDKQYMAIGQSAPIEEQLSKGKQNIRLDGNLEQFKIKSRMNIPFDDANITNSQKLILDSVFKYKDVVFPYQHYKDESSIRDLYAAHAVNHIYKTRDRILKNNLKLSTYKEALEQGKASVEDEPELRDQSFNRPKVLILLPTRQACFAVGEKIIEISGLQTVENKKRFYAQYYSDDKVPEYKSNDFKYLFDGNSNDFFCLGMKFTRKTLKFYSAFNQSDIILASPLGLKAILEKKEKNKNNKDFLSSIEVFVVDQANSLQYQNWGNVSYILKHLNTIPENYSEDLDFSRIRMWAINNQFKYLRQNLVFGKFSTPEMNNLIGNKHSLNLSGKVKFKRNFTSDESGIGQIVFKLRQVFNRFECELPVNDPNARFNYFKTNIVPFLKEQSDDKEGGGALVYLPDYSDYLRVKNYLRYETSVNFCSLDEYSSQSKLTKYRDGFAKGKYKVMLYTERLHHYNRFEIKGVRNVVFYKCPSDETYYSEILLRFLGDSMMRDVIKDINLSVVKIMYSKWDANLLEKIVGTQRVPVLCFGSNEIYEFK